MVRGPPIATRTAHPFPSTPPFRSRLRIHGYTPRHIDVCDNGPGVPEALKPQLCTPFATGRADGLGLGLAIASQIMADFGGRLLLIPSPLGGAGFRPDLQRA